MNKRDSKVRLSLVEDFSGSWHRHYDRVNVRTHDTEFERGMMRAYANCIRKALGSDASLGEIEFLLENNRI